MIYNAYWSKAFSVSCAVHIVGIILLVLVLGKIDYQPIPAQYITLELAEVADSSSPASEPAQVRAAASVNQTVLPLASQAKPAGIHPAVSPSAAQSLTSSESASAATFAVREIGGSGERSDTQTAGNSAPESGALKPAEGGELDSIINAFLLRIEKRKDYPYIARRRGQEGTVTVAVRLSEAGELTGVQVVRSSGVAALDEAALTLVRKVCPFAHNAGRIIAMNIPIAYQIE